MKIPFDIKLKPQIESGEYKVETRDGKPVRIICWDKKSEKKYGYHIVGLVEFGPQYEESTYYTIDGKGRLKDKEPELFIVIPEPELTEFEKEYIRLYKEGYAYGKAGSKPISDDNLKEYAAELLDLARKEIMDGWSKGLRDTQDFSGKAYNDGYSLGLKMGYDKGKAEALKEIEQDPESSYAFKRGVEYGKEEALKDLPRWKKIGGGNNYSSEVKFAINGRYLEMNNTLNDVYEIKLLDLEKLPKED